VARYQLSLEADFGGPNNHLNLFLHRSKTETDMHGLMHRMDDSERLRHNGG